MITLDYFGMEGKGRTVTEAKKDAGAKIQSALKKDYIPSVLQFRGQIWVAWQTPTGICSSLVGTDEILTGICLHGDESFANVVAQGRLSLAQIMWNGEEDESPFLHPHTKQAESFTNWVKFQKAYKAARARGMDEEKAREYAVLATILA